MDIVTDRLRTETKKEQKAAKEACKEVMDHLKIEEDNDPRKNGVISINMLKTEVTGFRKTAEELEKKVYSIIEES